MSDYISRTQAIDAIGEKSDEIYKIKQKGATYPHDAFFQGMAYAENVVKQLPSAQPDKYWKEQCQSYEQTINKLRESLSAQSEIVRCKNCKHWIPYDWMFSEVWQSRNIADYSEDDIGCNLCDMAMKSNDFCSRGERREVTT